MTEDQFAAWLEDNGFAESLPGYGHATGTEIANALYNSGRCVVWDEPRY